MLKVGINALYIKWGVNAGTETYFTNIVKPWYEREISDTVFTLYCNEVPPWWEGERPHFKIALYPKAKRLINRLLIEQTVFPLTLRGKNDVFFNPGYVGIVFLNTSQVTTIHDGFAWVYPKKIRVMQGFYWKLLIPLTAKKAKKIIAVSHNTAKDIEKYCGIRQEKISVIYEGGAHFGKYNPSDILSKYNIETKSFFHCIGLLKDIKNPDRILEAFKKYKTQFPDATSKLILAGHAAGKRATEILDYAASIKDVVYVGRINDDEVVELYKNSLGLVFPSLYEGFGIPILEAQNFNCPVITSNVSAMPEVAGGGAIIVNPLSVDEIADAMNLLENTGTSLLIERGKKNLTRFSWDKASVETFEILKKVGNVNK